MNRRPFPLRVALHSIPYYFHRSSFSNGDVVKLTLAQEVSFLNKASIKETLDRLPENTAVIIDASQTEYIDFDVLELIRDFHESKAADRNIKLSLIGFKDTYKVPATDSEDLNDFENGSEVPKQSNGNYQNLLQELTKNN